MTLALSHEGFKTAIIGTGFMGRVHLEAVRRLGFVDVCGGGWKTRSLAEGSA